MRHNQRRDEAARRSGEIYDAVQGASKVRRQILRVLQIRQRGGSVETQRQRDDGDVHIRIGADVAERQQKEAGNDVR